MAEKLGEVLGTIIVFALVYAGSAIALGGFIGMVAGFAKLAFNCF